MAYQPSPGGQPVMQGRNDEDLAQTIRDLYGLSREVNNANVEVLVFRGVVTLKGLVATSEAKQAAERLARGVPGVASVINEITLAASR